VPIMARIGHAVRCVVFQGSFALCRCAHMGTDAICLPRLPWLRRRGPALGASANGLTCAPVGYIGHAGQGHVRGLLVQTALGAARVPGPLHAFYARVAGLRGHAIAIVAVARKIAVLAWHLVTHDVDYCRTPARLTAAKIRAVELAVGAPSRRGRLPGSGDARERATLEHEMERAVFAQAEAAFVAFVEALQETEAVAAKRGASGLSQGLGPARLRGGGESPTSAFATGVDRVRAEHTPMG
jgi:hypothetical protein